MCCYYFQVVLLQKAVIIITSPMKLWHYLFVYFWSTQHGIGTPSLIVILHEILKLLHYAEAQDVKFFRIGTSGGLGKIHFNWKFGNYLRYIWKSNFETFNLKGLEPGTVVITRTAVNALLEPFSEQVLQVKDLCIDKDTL